jgi:hypothetical protein
MDTNFNDIMATIRLEIKTTMDGLRPWYDESRPYLDYRPHDGGWSVRLILEHVMLTSHYLLILIDKASSKAQRRALQLPVTTDWSRYELFPDKLASIGVHKSFTWMRPEHMEPAGKMSLNEIEEKINGQFARCEDHLQVLAHGEGALCLTTMTVNGIGKLDVYQYIYFLALHARRHLAQLEETKNEFNREYARP